MRRDDFERLPSSARAETCKLLSRDDVRLELGDEREGDYIGRLAAVFGAPDPDGEFAFRHRPTGLAITAYAAQSGPSYGGSLPRQGAPPDPQVVDDKMAVDIQLFDRRRPMLERARLHEQRRRLARASLEPQAPGSTRPWRSWSG